MKKKIIEWNIEKHAEFCQKLGLKSDNKYFIDVVISCLVEELRIIKKLTQKQLAKKCNTKQPAIARLENTGVASIPLLEKIGKACGYQLKIYYEKT